MMAANPFDAHKPAVAPPPNADVAPLTSIAQIDPVIQSSPTVNREPATGVASIMPSLFVKSGQKKRRAMIFVTSTILALVALLAAVMIFSRVR